MKRLLFIVGIFTLFVSCNRDDEINVPLNNEVNEFVWQGLRTYYFWQAQVPDLADDRFRNFDDLHTFLNQFPTPESLFDHFLFDGDRFSWIVDNYVELDNSLQGISTSFGYEYGLVKIGNSSEVFGYVEYVLPDSPAEAAGLKRGDLFDKSNGVILTESNFRELLMEVDNQTLSLGDFVSRDEGINSNGEEITMSAVEINENPVYLAKTLDINNTKVGYLVYNQFINTYHEDLNSAFGQFVSEGVTDLVLDLRYNSGGSVTTSRVLASMIYGAASSDDVLGSIVYNERLSQLNNDLTFFEEVPLFDSENQQIGTLPMNRLNINRITILSGRSTASASELLITGLLPYLDVTLIGYRTVGKNVGSVTLYDSPEDAYLSKNGINPNHTYAMQPIISQLANSEGFTDYIGGLEPDVTIDELDFLSGLLPLGDENEPLLAQALAIFSGVGRTTQYHGYELEQVYHSKENKPYSKGILDQLSQKDKNALIDAISDVVD